MFQPLRSVRPTLPIVLAALAAAPASSFAQGGPWRDGEIVVRSEIGLTQAQALFRIEPETGHGEELLSGFYWAGWAGSLVFDPYRDALLGNFGMPPSIFMEELWAIAPDGSLTLIPGFHDQVLRALAPTGDGRVYLQHHTFGPTQEILYLDATDATHTLMDATGTAPFSFGAEHLLYHAPTNSLFATTSGAGALNHCVQHQSGIFRIPLAPDGSRVAGPVDCASVAAVPNNIMSLDVLPGGDLLVQMAGSQFFNETMRRVDPVTLTSTVFASPSQADVNGTLWSARIGKAVLLDDTANELRLFSEGQTGPGLLLASDVDVSPPTTGFSPSETMIELDLYGASCSGTGYAYGNGLAGTAGFMPQLSLSGCPDLGLPVTVQLSDVMGGAPGGLMVSVTQTSLPVAGGTLYVLPFFTQGIVASGSFGVGGDGALALPTQFNAPGLVGTSLFLQAGFIDPGAIQGVSLTNALQIGVG